MTLSFGEDRTRSKLARIHKAVDGASAVGAEGAWIVAAADGKDVEGMNVIIGQTWTWLLGCQPTSDVQWGSSLPGAGLNRRTPLSNLLLSNVVPGSAPSTVVWPTLSVGHARTAGDITGVYFAVHWVGAVRTGSGRILTATGGIFVSGVDVTVRQSWALPAAASSAVDAKVSPVFAWFCAGELQSCANTQYKGTHHTQQEDSSSHFEGKEVLVCFFSFLGMSLVFSSWFSVPVKLLLIAGCLLFISTAPSCVYTDTSCLPALSHSLPLHFLFNWSFHVAVSRSKFPFGL